MRIKDYIIAAFERASGILMHPTSLPGPYGIGDLGPEAYKWVDFLESTGTNIWQVLPLGPTGFGDSPYQCFSAMAGNPFMISPDVLLEQGILLPEDLTDIPDFLKNQVDFGEVTEWKMELLNTAFARFTQLGQDSETFQEFKSKHADWLEDFALFMALKEHYQGKPWVEWSEELRDRKPIALKTAKNKFSVEVEKHKFLQFIFFTQWIALKKEANQRGIIIIGDAPLYVAHDSSDVWVAPDLFYLDHEGQPTVVAGVPPDYFSRTGQRWGNPIYRWDLHQKDGYQWWIKRIKMLLEMNDKLRLDHFRGFAGYWEVPASEETAELGRWLPGPGEPIFLALQNALGENLPLIAEDLGEITPDVIELRDRFNLPGMKIFQFAFNGDPNHDFLPHRYPENSVAMTGAHDNEPLMSWWGNIDENTKEQVKAYLQSDGSRIAWDMIRVLWESKAKIVIIQAQDFMELDSSSRMNIPGVLGGNWAWRMQDGELTEWHREKLTALNKNTSR